MEPDLFTAAAEERQEKDPAGSPLAVTDAPARPGRGGRPAAPPETGLPAAAPGGGGRGRTRRAVVGHPVGSAGHRGRRRSPTWCRKATNKRFVELSAITAGVKEVRAVIESRAAPGGFDRRPSFPGRDPPLHQGPAGLAAARGRGPLGHPHRGHDGGPVLLGDLPSAVPLPPAHPRPLYDDDVRGPGAAGARRRTGAGGLSPSRGRPRAPAADRGRRRAPGAHRPGGRRGSAIARREAITLRPSRRRPSRGGEYDRAATSTTTWRAPSSSPSAAPTWTRRCTTWRG